jgi:hypothetical protein
MHFWGRQRGNFQTLSLVSETLYITCNFGEMFVGDFADTWAHVNGGRMTVSSTDTESKDPHLRE